MPDNCVSCAVTSPPYYQKRAYGTAPQVWGDPGDCRHRWADSTVRNSRHADDSTAGPKQKTNRGAVGGRGVRVSDTCLKCGGWRGELGQEPTASLFVAHLVELFREVRRVLHPSGVLWLNIGDSFANDTKGPNGKAGTRLEGRPNQPAVRRSWRGDGLKKKDLIGVPWRVALALQDDGWHLRAENIWCKASPMPESVRDRPTVAHEHVFLLTKRGSYFYDQEAERIPNDGRDGGGHGVRNGVDVKGGGQGNGYIGNHPAGRNLWTYWTDIRPSPFADAHFATFPEDLPARCIRLGSSERGVCPACSAPLVRVMHRRGSPRTGQAVKTGSTTLRPSSQDQRPNGATLAAWKAANPDRFMGWKPSCQCDAGDPVPSLILDPFAGSGTTLAVAVKLKRRALGIELNPEYAKLAEKRLAGPLGIGGLYAPDGPVTVGLFDHLEAEAPA